MKFSFLAGLCLAALICVNPCFAGNDPSDSADLSDAALLSGVATPALVSAAGVCLTLGVAHQVVRLVDAGGNGLSELTADGFDIAAQALESESDCARVEAHKKVIPLVVRKDYLQLNEKVKTQ